MVPWDSSSSVVFSGGRAEDQALVSGFKERGGDKPQNTGPEDPQNHSWPLWFNPTFLGGIDSLGRDLSLNIQ